MKLRGILLKSVSVLALCAGAGHFCQSAAAALITFDDLSDGGTGTAIADGYQGMNWTNWFVLNTPDFTSIFGPNGATAGTVSAPNIAFNGSGDTAIFSSQAFTLISADLTAFWRDNLQVTVTGQLLGVTVDLGNLNCLGHGADDGSVQLERDRRDRPFYHRRHPAFGV